MTHWISVGGETQDHKIVIGSGGTIPKKQEPGKNQTGEGIDK